MTGVGLLVALVTAILLVAVVVLMVVWLGARRDAAAMKARFGPVVDLDAEAGRLRVEREALKAEIAGRRSAFEAQYGQAVAELEALTKEVGVYREDAELQSFGLYHPHFDFADSDAYKRELEKVYAQQAAMLKAKQAATCSTEWQVEGSKTKGRQMTDRYLKLQLRAFNGECDAIVARVRFNNVVAMGERMRKAFEALNKLGETQTCRIVFGFLDLKLAELRLTHEHAEKIQAEKEEQRRIREQMREEEQAQREIEQAQKEAEREEDRYEKALAKARAELAHASEREREASEAKIQDLERRLAEAHAARERAISRAQMTKSGHVYVISNEGSFGPDVFKVGMTRRLEPLDRVRELGDASVPFSFDIHAIIYSEDAPGLENEIHKRLDGQRVNLVNDRKEFFVASLDDIEAAARACCGEAEFARTAVAEEYRKTLAIRAERAGKAAESQAASPPAAAARKHLDEIRERWQTEAS